MSERLNKTSICSVVFLDIVNQSKKPVAEQIRDKDLFNGFINEAIKDVAQNDRILLDTGDGAAIALLGAPEEALFVALTIRDNIIKHNKDNEHQLYVRTGINLGPVRVVSDINGRPNILGDGINVAERVMSFAGPNQILVSRSYYEITSRLTEEITSMFSYFGVRQDKHVREHEVYSIRSADEEPFVAESAAEPVAAASLFSRILNNENLSRYGFWGSAVLVVVVISAGAFMLVSNMFTPDLGDVVANTPVPGVKAAALQAAPMPATQPETPKLDAVAPVMARPDATGATDNTATNQPITTTAKAETSMEATENQSSSKKKAEPAKQAERTAVTKQKSTVAAGPPVESRTLKEEPQASPQDRLKTGWEAFRESFRQGRKERVCTQAEIALNQCG
jgi:hypothetical protein